MWNIITLRDFKGKWLIDLENVFSDYRPKNTIAKEY